MNHNTDNTDNAGQAFETQEGKHPDKWKKYVVGGIFLLLADLTARTLLSPIELPIGVVTSIVGAVAFVIIFYKTRKAR